jgi:hypothetical protein
MERIEERDGGMMETNPVEEGETVVMVLTVFQEKGAGVNIEEMVIDRGKEKVLAMEEVVMNLDIQVKDGEMVKGSVGTTVNIVGDAGQEIVMMNTRIGTEQVMKLTVHMKQGESAKILVKKGARVIMTVIGALVGTEEMMAKLTGPVKVGTKAKVSIGNVLILMEHGTKVNMAEITKNMTKVMEDGTKVIISMGKVLMVIEHTMKVIMTEDTTKVMVEGGPISMRVLLMVIEQGMKFNMKEMMISAEMMIPTAIGEWIIEAKIVNTMMRGEDALMGLMINMIAKILSGPELIDLTEVLTVKVAMIGQVKEEEVAGHTPMDIEDGMEKTSLIDMLNA